MFNPTATILLCQVDLQSSSYYAYLKSNKGSQQKESSPLLAAQGFGVISGRVVA